MGTSICRLPLFTETERAVETSIVGIDSLASVVSSGPGSATSGMRIGSAGNGIGLGSEDISPGEAVILIGSAVSLEAGAVVLSGNSDAGLSFASFAGGGGGSRPMLMVRFGRFRPDFSLTGGFFSFFDTIFCS